MSNQDTTTSASAGPIGSPRNLVLACIGLASLLADALPALLERSVQRGSVVLERAQREARTRRIAPPAEELPEETQLELSRLGLPTHRDLDSLLAQINELEQQIDRIAEQRSSAAR